MSHGPPAAEAEVAGGVHLPARADAGMVPSRSAIVSTSVAVVGVLNYGGTLLFAHVLDAPSYSAYAAGATMLGMVGTFAAALVPMPLTHVIRGHPRHSEARRRSLSFAWLVSGVAGVLAALVTGSVMAAFAPPTVVAAVAVSALTLFAISPVWAWLSGELMFVRAALTGVVEVAARIAFSAGAVLLGWTTAGALTGFTVGVMVVLLCAPRGMHRDMAWRPGVIRERARWTETGDIALTQLIASTLVGADVVLVALLHAPAAEGAGYQALSTLAKGPVYVATGAVIVAFPLLRSPGAQIDRILTAALRSFALLALPAAAIVATIPRALLTLVLPQRYADSLRLLPVLAAAGVGYAAIAMFTTVLLGLRAYRRCQLGLLLGAALLPAGMLSGWAVAGVPGLAGGAAIGALGAASAIGATALPLFPSGTLGRALRGLLLTAALVGTLALARPLTALWLGCVALLGLTVLRRLARRPVAIEGDARERAR